MARSLCALRRPVTPSLQRRRSTRGTRALRAADATASASVRNAAVVNARQRARTTHRAHWSVGGAAGGVRVTVGAPQRRDASARRNASRDERLRPDVLAIGGASYFRHDARGAREPSRSVRHGVGGHRRRADAAAPSARSRVPRRRAAWRGGSRRSAHKERATPVLSPFRVTRATLARSRLPARHASRRRRRVRADGAAAAARRLRRPLRDGRSREGATAVSRERNKKGGRPERRRPF